MVFEIIFGEEVLGIWILLAYLFFFLVARTLFIAIPWHRWIQSQIDNMRNNICVKYLAYHKEPNSSENCMQLRTNILKQSNDLLDKAEKLIVCNWNRGFFFWSGSHEIDALLMVYEADRHTVWLLSRESLYARIKRATGEVEELPKTKKDVWQTVFKNALKYTWNKSDEETDLKKADSKKDNQYRACLNQFLAELYCERIKNLTSQFNLLNKAMWLILIGLLLITSLMLSGYGLVLLAGAVGGLLSRLQRMLISKEMYTDFSVYWVSLFYSPMMGALAAWAGILLVIMLQDLNVLTQSIKISLPPTDATLYATLGLAILFGISERFLDNIVKQAESKLSPEEKGQ